MISQRARSLSAAVSAKLSTKFDPQRLLKQLRGTQLEYLIAWLYVTSSVGFAFGSIWFLPQYDGTGFRDAACWLFIFGSVVILLIACADMAEALSVGSHLEEMVIQTMYIVGCLSFTVGTIFYFPHIGKAVGHPGEEAGGWLFTLGRRA